MNDTFSEALMNFLKYVSYNLTGFFWHFQFPIVITSPGKEPSTRKGKKLDKLAVEWSVDPKDFREVDRQAIPIVLISDGGKRFFPTKYQSTQTYTKYKLQLVANLAANCLSESNTIDIRVLEDDIKEPFTNLKTSIRQFLRSHPAQVADPASAGTKVVQRVKGAVVPSILQNPPSPQNPFRKTLSLSLLVLSLLFLCNLKRKNHQSYISVLSVGLPKVKLMIWRITYNLFMGRATYVMRGPAPTRNLPKKRTWKPTKNSTAKGNISMFVKKGSVNSKPKKSKCMRPIKLGSMANRLYNPLHVINVAKNLMLNIYLGNT